METRVLLFFVDLDYNCFDHNLKFGGLIDFSCSNAGVSHLTSCGVDKVQILLSHRFKLQPPSVHKLLVWGVLKHSAAPQLKATRLGRVGKGITVALLKIVKVRKLSLW